MKLINNVLTAKGKDVALIFDCINSQIGTLLRVTSDKNLIRMSLDNPDSKKLMMKYIEELLDLNELMCGYNGEIPEECRYKSVLNKEFGQMLLKLTPDDFFQMITTARSASTGKTLLES